MSARFICRQDPQGYWRISYRDGGLLAQGAYKDMLAIIRTIHGRTTPMTTDELITRAQHAIQTGQPRLAQLYMRKALEQTDQHRRELNPLGWQGRQMRRSLQAFADGLRGIAQTYVDAVMPVARRIAEIAEEAQNNYTLAGPAK